MQYFLQAQWNKKGLWAWLMLPLSLLVCLVAGLKRLAYRRGVFKQARVNVPVIVIGNLSVGGAGKTPLVAHIAQLLLRHGYAPGIISRGYKGTASRWPQAVVASSDPVQVGDEPVMLASLTDCPVGAGPNRVDTAQYLIDQNHCDIVLSDDGFQHLKLARDIDILVFDAAYGDGLGNGWCLPSGPLREAASAKRLADIQVLHGNASSPMASGSYPMTLIPGDIYSLQDKSIADYETLRQQTLHAIAGIAHPQRFFESLQAAGLTIIEHAFNDHQAYTPDDLKFEDEFDIVTTEKDAIKLTPVQCSRTIWVLPVTAKLGQHFDAELLKMLKNLPTRS